MLKINWICWNQVCKCWKSSELSTVLHPSLMAFLSCSAQDQIQYGSICQSCKFWIIKFVSYFITWSHSKTLGASFIISVQTLQNCQNVVKMFPHHFDQISICHRGGAKNEERAVFIVLSVVFASTAQMKRENCMPAHTYSAFLGHTFFWMVISKVQRWNSIKIL